MDGIEHFQYSEHQFHPHFTNLHTETRLILYFFSYLIITLLVDAYGHTLIDT
jgi:hypothetical protein